MEIDLKGKNLVIELYEKDSSDCMSVQVEGSDSGKFNGLSIEKTVSYVMDKYERNSISDAVKRNVEEIIEEDPNYWFDIYGNFIQQERDEVGNLLVNHRLESISDSKYFKDLTDPNGNPYLISEIRVKDSDIKDLGDE
jgi:hypothetical protein